MAEVTNPRMDALRARKDQYETSKKIPLPTPPIGVMVQFFRNGNLNEIPIPGVVVRQCAPGQVDLKLFVANSQNNENANGVHFKDHPFLISNSQILKLKGSGVFDYIDGQQPTQIHKKMHVDELDRQIKSLDDQLRAERLEELRREAQDKELAAKDKAAVAAGK